MSYLKELRDQRRPLLAAVIGLGSGFSAVSSNTGVMAQHLLPEFGWTRAEFAAVNSLSFVMVLAFPFVGRLADVVGVRRTALIGVIALPLTFMGLSTQNGDMRLYAALFMAQALFCITTTATVYTRIVVQYVERARGLALAIVASGPAIAGAIGGPLLSEYVEAQGWREGYLALAAFTAAFGALALLIMPPERRVAATQQKVRHNAREDYAIIFRAPAFWLLVVALLLCNLPQTLALHQMTILLEDNGVTTANAAPMISAFAIGMLTGRFICGIALDRFPVPLVAFVSLGVPSLGLFLLASSLDAPTIITFSIFLCGFSFGAEGDLVAYVVARQFGVAVYGSVMGLLTAVMSSSISLGALLLSFTFSFTDTFVAFLLICGVAVIVGASLFLLLRSKCEPETVAALKRA
jgi:predicted MFS family arabinose efflux permease